ncbi:MAG TPA: hypothetical protein VJ617_10845 [Arthrobacter sp.]|nr:hypothetical protein [Arthrobacter sp.]
MGDANDPQRDHRIRRGLGRDRRLCREYLYGRLALFPGRPHSRHRLRSPTSARRVTSSPLGALSHLSATTRHHAAW